MLNPVDKVVDLIKLFLRAAIAYLELKRETFYYEAEAKFLEEKEVIRRQINENRNKKTISSTDIADHLQLLLEERAKSWERVSTAYLATGKRHESAN
jgi:hypothetical protein